MLKPKSLQTCSPSELQRYYIPFAFVGFAISVDSWAIFFSGITVKSASEQSISFFIVTSINKHQYFALFYRGDGETRGEKSKL